MIPRSPLLYFSTLKSNRQLWLWPLLIFLLSIAIALVLINYEKEQNKKKQRELVNKELRDVAQSLQTMLSEKVLLAKGMAQIIASNYELHQEEFFAMGDNLIKEEPFLINFAVTEGMVIKRVFPLKGNENILGLNYEALPEQLEAIYRARDSKKIVVAGPVQLVQGGSAFVIRAPFYKRQNNAIKEEFSGFFSLAFDEKKLYQWSGLHASDLSIDIAIKGKDGLGEKGDVFYGAADIFEKSPIIKKVPIGDGFWQLAAIPHGGWNNSRPYAVLFEAIGVIIALLLSLFTYFYIKHKILRRESEAKHKALFKLSSLSILLENFSALKILLDNLGLNGVDSFRSYLKNNQDFLLDLIKKIQLVDVNKAAVDLLQYPNKTTLLKSEQLLRYLHNGDDFLLCILAFMEGKTEYSKEIKIYNFYGDTVDVLIHYTLIDSVEPWSNVLVNIINISARKAAERAERELAQTIIAIFNATPAHIAMIDEQGVIKNVNEEWRQFAKNNALISNNYCLGENYLTVCESVDAPEEARAIAVGIRYVLGGKIPRFSLEYPCHSPDEQRWFRCTITPLHEDFHHGAVITHINITERKLAEEKIKEITSRFQAMFDYAPYGIMLVDVKLSEVVQWNARLVSMLGSESVVVNNGQLKNDFIGRLIEEVRKFALLAGSSEDNTKIQCEYNNNGLRYFEVSIAPVYLNNDVAQHYLCMVEDVTDFRVVEAEKVEVERLYKDIVNSVDSVVWQVDAETFQFTYVSKQAEAILGYSVEECLQKDFWLEHLHPEDKESAANFCMSKTQMLESHIFEYRFIKKDGSVIWLQDVVNVIAENNKPKFLRGLLIDITNNKLQENRKKIHNRVMELIATDASLDDVLILIADYLCSAHVGIDCGIDLYDKENNMSTALILPELPVDVLTFIDQCRVEQCALHHAVFDDQAFFAHKEQCLYEMGIKSYCEQLIFSTSGEVLGVIFLYVRDVGYPSKEDSEELKAAARLAAIVIERKKNEQNIQLISDRLQLATTSAGVGIWDYSVETQNTIWNDVMYQLFGLQPIKEDGTDAHWLKGVHQDDQKYIQQEMQLTLETGKEFKIEFRVYWPDNSLHTLFGVGAAQRNTKNVIERVIGTCWDISELKNTEYQLRQLNDHLEERVSLRTVELERAKDLAEIASKAKTNFLSNMSHEIRTPMNSLIGMAYLLSNTTLNKKQQVYLNAIQKSGKHLLYIIDDILDFSKIEAGKLLLSKHVFDVLDLKNIIEDLFLQAAEAKFLSLIVNVADDIPKVVYGDMHRLQQVLFNLVGNAIKFTHKGGVTVNIDVANKKGDELLLLFKISDTGIGMSAEQQRRLFQPFVQGDTSISRRFGGTGLGLVISMELVMLMDGEMGVHSQLGEGTEMWFTCLLEVNTSQSQSQSQSQSLDALLNARILIVEDNEFNQQVAVDLLECVGAVSFVANNGQEAIEMLHSNSYDCILMDMQMPVMDGLQAARLIRENTAIKQIPIIAMTANASERERALCIEAGMNDFISKPVNPDVFYQMIAQWLSEIESIDALEHVVEEIMLENKDTIDLPNNPAVIDLNILASLLGYNRDKLNTFSYKFIETAQKGMLDISNAIANNDEKALHATGHRIKSSAKTVGALDFAALCQSLETVDIAKKDYVGQIVAQLDQLLVEIQSVVDSYFSVSIEDNEVFIDEESSNLRVLVIDDEEFQIDYVKAKLHALNIVDVIPAFNGDQAMAQFDAANPKPELIICDINMPWMDGIEFLRNLSERKYKGGVILLSGMDASMLKAAELLAGVHKVNLLAALPKPLKLDALLVALAKLDDILNKDSDLYSNDLIESKILTIEELRHAILNGQLELYYQPKVLVVDKSVIGFECLVRIRHPEKGLIQPNDFISIAEQYHLIDDLTLEVLNKAAVQLGEWRSQGHNLVASVNVSMDNLTCLTLPELFERVVRNASIEPKNIILELTESRLMQNYSVSLEIITRLRLKGFGLSIDDFGTGFSSMDNLKNLPVTELKVDRAFVRGATKDKSANTILSSSIALGKSFNLMVVAEGVETEEDWNLIEEKGCDEAQGYFIARPMTAEDFIVWKQSWDEKHNIS